MTVQAESAAAACEAAFEMMQLDSSLGECSAALVEAPPRRSRRTLRRRMLAESGAALASYHVTILLRGDVVDAMALESALVHLAAEGVTTMTTEVDPATELEAIPGVDEALVEAFEEEVEAAAPAKPSATATTTEADPAAGPAVAPPLPPPAPIASETTLLAAVAEAALDEEDGELMVAEATIMADAAASGRLVNQVSMTIEAADADGGVRLRVRRDAHRRESRGVRGGGDGGGEQKRRMRRRARERHAELRRLHHPEPERGTRRRFSRRSSASPPRASPRSPRSSTRSGASRRWCLKASWTRRSSIRSSEKPRLRWRTK